MQLPCRLHIDTYDVAAVALYCIFIETCCLFTADSRQHTDSNRDPQFPAKCSYTDAIATRDQSLLQGHALGRLNKGAV